MSGYRVPILVGDTRVRDHQMWPTTEEPLYSTILSGNPVIDAPYWGLKNISSDQLLALAWRVSEWRFTGGWTATVKVYTDPGHVLLGTDTVTVTIKNSPVSKGYFATCDNDLTTFHFPVVKEAHLVHQTFGPQRSPKAYATDYNFPMHSFGILINNLILHTIVNDGVTTIANDSGSMRFELFRDFTSLATFSAGRGVDMVKWDALGGGPTGPPTFDVYCLLDGEDGFVTSGIDTKGALPNVNIVLDPVIAPAMSIPTQIVPGAAPGITFEVTAASCDIAITAFSFFPFCTTTGLVVYDTATGAQINDPLS